MSRLNLCSATFALFLLLVAPVYAGTVYLQDGSVLNGNILLLRDGELTIGTDFAGELKISQANVRSIETSKIVTLRRKNGDEVEAQLKVIDDAVFLVNGEVAGNTQIAIKQLEDLRPLGAPSPELLAKRARIPADGPWSGQLQAGLSGSSGNSDNQNIDVRAVAERDTGDNRLTLEALLHKATQDDQQTEDELKASARLEHDYSERAFVFGKIEAERDQFEDIDYRYRLTIGPGYFLIREPDHELKARAGLGFEQERVDTGETNNNFVATLGYNYFVDLWEWFRFTHDITLIPDIGDEPTKNYRVESALGGELPLGSTDSLWRLRGEYRHDYDNNPEPGVDELDSNYLFSIVRDFE